MDYIMVGLNSSNTKVAAAAIRCLHSLSRSVQLLRTTFQDHAVWRPLMKVNDVLQAFSTLKPIQGQTSSVQLKLS